MVLGRVSARMIESAKVRRDLLGVRDQAWRLCVRKVLLIGFVLAVSFMNSRTSKAVELKDLREKFIAEVSSIASIEVRFKKHGSGRIGNLKLTPTGEPPPPRRYTWAKQGSMELLTLEAWESPMDKGSYERHWFSFDGQKGYELHYLPGAPDELRVANILPSSPATEFCFHAQPGLLIGLKVWGSAHTLVDLFQRPATKYVGQEEIDGHSCHRIDFGEYEGYDDLVRTATIWIDEEHGYLPRKVMFQETRNRKTGEILGAVTPQWVVKEFMQVSDPLRQDKRWFPKSVVRGVRATTINLEIESATINVPMAQTRFTPELPLGTTLVMHDQPVSVPGGVQRVPKLGIVGGEAGIRAQQEREKRIRQREERRDQEAAAREAEAYQRRVRIWLTAITVGVVVTALIGFVAWRQRSGCASQ